MKEIFSHFDKAESFGEYKRFWPTPTYMCEQEVQRLRVKIIPIPKTPEEATNNRNIQTEIKLAKTKHLNR